MVVCDWTKMDEAKIATNQRKRLAVLEPDWVKMNWWVEVGASDVIILCRVEKCRHGHEMMTSQEVVGVASCTPPNMSPQPKI